MMIIKCYQSLGDWLFERDDSYGGWMTSHDDFHEVLHSVIETPRAEDDPPNHKPT